MRSSEVQLTQLLIYAANAGTKQDQNSQYKCENKMKRDDDYLRELLKEIEGSKDLYFPATLDLGSTPEQIKKHQHADLLSDANYLQSIKKGLYRLTNQGHDFRAATKDEAIWAKTKSIASNVGGATVGMLKDIAVAVVKTKITELTGLSI